MDFTRDPRLAKLATPTLVIWGRDDKVNKPSGAAMLGAADAQRRRPADCQYRPLGPVGTGGLLQRGHHRIPERLIANVHHHHPLGVRQRPPGLCRHRNRQVRRLETLRPRGNRDAPRRHGTRHGPIPLGRQRMPRPAAARTGRGRRRAGLAPRRACDLRRDQSPRRRPRGAHRRGHATRTPSCAASSASCGSPGPTDSTQEIYTTARTAPLPLDIPGSGFVTGAGGLGHVALTTKKPHGCAATTTTSTTRGCPTTSTRPSTA